MNEFNMDKIKIQKNIPLPLRSFKSGVAHLFNKMEVGDSFFIKKPENATISQLQGQLSNNAIKFSVEIGLGWKFTTKTVTEKGVKGVRIWRIK